MFCGRISHYMLSIQTKRTIKKCVGFIQAVNILIIEAQFVTNPVRVLPSMTPCFVLIVCFHYLIRHILASFWCFVELMHSVCFIALSICVNTWPIIAVCNVSTYYTSVLSYLSTVFDAMNSIEKHSNLHIFLYIVPNILFFYIANKICLFVYKTFQIFYSVTTLSTICSYNRARRANAFALSHRNALPEVKFRLVAACFKMQQHTSAT